MWKLSVPVVAIAVVFASFAQAEEPEFELGLIGLDTSHVIAFTRILNDPGDANHVPGARIVAAYQGGSDDLPSSYERVEGYTEQLVQDWGVTLYDTIEELCENVDAILLTSVDGRPHLEQARPVIEAGLPIFIDKPLAASLEDAVAIFDLAEAHEVPMFSSSSLRYYDSVVEMAQADVGAITGADSVGPCAIEPTHPDLFWYGIHAVEMLFTIMGPDCEEVVRVHTEDTDLVVGRWADGRVGTFRGIRNAHSPFRLTIYGTDGIEAERITGSYRGQLEVALEMFRTGEPPISREETLAIFAFMQAAEVSKERDGAPVRLDEVLEAAENAQ